MLFRSGFVIDLRGQGSRGVHSQCVPIAIRQLTPPGGAPVNGLRPFTGQQAGQPRDVDRTTRSGAKSQPEEVFIEDRHGFPFEFRQVLLVQDYPCMPLDALPDVIANQPLGDQRERPGGCLPADLVVGPKVGSFSLRGLIWRAMTCGC